MPDRTFFAGLECLQTLFLHDNEIRKLSAISGLGGCQALRVLTLHSTPLASATSAYRAMTLSLCPSLLCLDGAVITDKDHLPEAHEMLPEFFMPIRTMLQVCFERAFTLLGVRATCNWMISLDATV